jgi:hypothetical protein
MAGSFRADADGVISFDPFSPKHPTRDKRMQIKQRSDFVVFILKTPLVYVYINLKGIRIT